MISIESLNTWANSWATWMSGGLIDATVMLAAVALIWLMFRRRMSAQLVYCLFLLVLVKLVVPIRVTTPEWSAWFSPQYAINRLTENWKAESEPLTDSRATTSASIDPAKSPIGNEIRFPSGVLSEVVAKTKRTPVLTTRAKLMLAWGTAVFSLLTWFVVTQWQTRRFLRAAEQIDPSTLPADVAHLQTLAGIGGTVPILESKHISSPAIVGLLRPRVLVPSGFFESMPDDRLRWVLLHELAHLRRRDLWVVSFQRFVQMLHFCNPAVWIANFVINRQREYACDDFALALSGVSRRECGEAFLSVVQRAGDHSEKLAHLLGMFPNKHSYRRRLMRLLDEHRRIHAKLSTPALIALLLSAIVLLPAVRAADDSAKETAPTADKRPPDNQKTAIKVSSSKSPEKDKLVKRDLEKLQGVWVMESYTTEGVKKSALEEGTPFRGRRLFVNGNHWIARYYGQPKDLVADEHLPRMQFGINPTKSPARIDYWPVNRPDGWRKLGIYRLEGDKLTICFRVLVAGGDDVKRPSKFDAKKGSRAGLAVYKRLQRR